MSSPFVFKQIGDAIVGRNTTGNLRTFLAFFGISPLLIFRLWRLIVEESNQECITPKHLMWTLLFLRCYSREEELATRIGVTEKTMRKWVWIVISKLGRIKKLVSFLLLTYILYLH